MKLLGTRQSARQRLDLIKEAIEPGASVKAIALRHKLDVEEFRGCVQLYRAHGEAIFAPDAASQLELELFKLKYPHGTSALGLFGQLKHSVRQSRRLIFHSLITLPLSLSSAVALLVYMADGRLVQGLGVGMGCLIAMMIPLLSGILILMTLEVSSRTAKGKLKELTYLKERREVLDKQEILGALQLSSDDDNLQGGLEVVQDKGGLELLDHQQDDIQSGKFGPPDEVAAALAMGYEVADSDDVRPEGGGWASAGRMHQGYPLTEQAPDDDNKDSD